MEHFCVNCGSTDYQQLFNKNGFDIVKCDKCKWVFTLLPHSFDLSSIYEEDYFQGGQSDGYADYLGSEKILKSEFKRLAKQLSKKFVENNSIPKLLEVGCAYGFFLSEASKFFECHGIEISKEAGNFARSKGLDVHCGEVNEAILTEIGNVDVIVMLDVIEHLPNPKKTVELLSKFLNKGGYFITVTGNFDSFFSRIMRKKWRLMTPPQHTFFFTEKTLTGLFRELNYEIIDVRSPWKFVPLGLAFYQIGSRSGFRIKQLERLSNFGLYLNLFDVIRVTAKKK